MNENNQLTEQEKDYLLNFLSNTSNNIKDKQVNANIMNSPYSNSDYISHIFLFLKALSLTSIRNKELSLQEYKNIFIHMKNIIIMYQRYLKDSDINEILLKIILIMLKKNFEFNQYNNMVLLFLQLIKMILDNNNDLIGNRKKTENYFKLILDNINSNSYNKEDFLILAKNSLMIYACLIDTNIIMEKFFIEIIQNYIVPLCDFIFSKTQIYIIPSISYNNEFISVLKCLYELLIICLKKMKRFFPSIKRKELSDSHFLKYGSFSLDLIKLIPIIEKDEIILNNILVFKEDYKGFNIMKSHIFQCLCLIVENHVYQLNNINNNDFLNIIYQIIYLIQESIKQILENENIFFNLRKIDDEKGEEEEYYNMLLYNMLYFLSKTIIKEPIKTEFIKNMQLFLLNIIFPLLVTLENESKYMSQEPESYCSYLNDLLYTLKCKDFRITGLILIKKIFDSFEDAPNFIFSYIIGMMDDILNKQEINNNIINNNIDIKYNIYEYYKSQNIFLNKYNEETKLDFCLLILILLQDNLEKYNILKNRLREILIKVQYNFSLIKNILIKIKISHLFKFVIPNLFNIDTNQKNETNNNSNSINEKNKQNISFIETALKFLFNNLKSTNNNLDDDDNYLSSDALKNEVSDIIIYLCKYTQGKNDILTDGINFLFQKEFHSLLNLVDNIKLYSFFSVIEQIITSVKIANRNDIFICLTKLTKRFEEENENGDINSQKYCPIYFSIISNFFKGINKMERNDINFPEEITKFNDIFQPILNHLKDINSFIYYENLIKTITEYIKSIQGINEQIIYIIKLMPNVIEKDRQFSEENFHYLSVFLTYLQFNPLNNDDNEELFDIVIKILEKSFSYEFGNYDTSKLYSLLITLQILNKNINISKDILKILFFNTVKCFNYIFKEDENYGSKKLKQEKNIIIFGIISLGYIFNPEETFNLLNDVEIMKNKPKNFYGESEYEIFNFSKYVDILNYINAYDIEKELIRKWLILGFCSIIKNKNLKKFLDENKNIKNKFVILFVKFILKHKEAEIKKRNKIVKSELNYSEIKINEDGKINYNEITDSDDEEEEKEDEDEEIIESKLNIDINYILEQNNNIKNSDEYKFFKESLDYLKETDIECINMIKKELDEDKLKKLEDIYYVKKIKVNYQGKEFEIPRKILNIKKNL